mgnify:CR=1 FL=1
MPLSIAPFLASKPYRDGKGNLYEGGTRVCAFANWPGRIKPGTFEPLTKGYVEAIRKALPKAKIIWASSTPVLLEGDVKKLDPVINGTIIEHNRMAAKVMAECGLPVSDFYALLVGKLELARGGKDKFHWTAPAYKILGDKCVESVLKALPTAAQ